MSKLKPAKQLPIVDSAKLSYPTLDPELLDLSEPNRNIVDFALRFVPGVAFIGIIVFAFYLASVNVRSFFILSTLFSIYNLWIVSNVAIYSTLYLVKWIRAEKRNFHEEYLARRRALLSLGHSEAQLRLWSDVIHYVVIPNYREHTSVLSAALENLARSSLARTNIIICLAMEAREYQAESKALELMKKHNHQFHDIIATFHPSDIPGEIPGKSSNDRWAVHEINKDVIRRGLCPSQVCITIADADSFVHPLYFEALTSQFCNDIRRDEKIWQGAMACYKNFLDVPAPTRSLAVTVTVHEFAALANKSDLHIPFSTYSASLNFVNLVGYDGDVIPEDWHFYIKGFFATGGRAKVETIPFPNICYAVESDSYFSSLKARLTQAVRHHWGVAEIVYFLRLVFRAYFINTDEAVKPDIVLTLKLFHKLWNPHFMAAVGTFWLVMPFLVLQYYEWQMAASPIALLSLREWSLLFRIISIITFAPLVWTVIVNFFIVKKCLEGEHSIKWHYALRWLAEMAIIFPIANTIFATIPVLYCSIKLWFTEYFNYVAAPKPVGCPTSPSTHRLEIV